MFRYFVTVTDLETGETVFASASTWEGAMQALHAYKEPHLHVDICPN